MPRFETSSSFLHLIERRLYGSVIAPLGQTSAQEPHSMQVSGSMLYLSPSEIASTGQTGKHVPQATQLSSITYAMMYFVLGVLFYLMNVFCSIQSAKLHFSLYLQLLCLHFFSKFLHINKSTIISVELQKLFVTSFLYNVSVM